MAYSRPAGDYAGTTGSNKTKYQTASAATSPRQPIDSSNIDGDFNYLIDAVNELEGNLPADQTGNSGKFLTTDGSSTSWSTVPTAGIADDAVTTAKMASGTANRLIGYDGSGNPGEVTVGTGLSLSGGSLTATSAGGMTLISTQTASGSATISFTGLSSSYKAYKVIMRDVTPSSGTPILYFRVSTDNGSNYLSTSIYHNCELTISTGTASGNTSFSQSAGLLIDSSVTLCGEVNIFNAGVAANAKIKGDISSYNTSSGARIKITSVEAAATTVNAIQFYMGSGNIASGTFWLYGIS